MNYKKESIFCLKCQGWNHIASECIKRYNLCGTCGEEGHQTSTCKAIGKQFCISCKTDNHPSWAMHCPTFIRKCKEFDQKHPENSLLFYPSQEPWLWAPELPKLEQQPHHPPAQAPIQYKPGSQRLRQQQLRFERLKPQGSRMSSTRDPHWL